MLKASALRRLWPAALMAAALSLTQPVALAATLDDVNWDGKTYSRTHRGAELEDVLQNIAREVGVGVELSDAAKQLPVSVTRQYQDEPAREAFESLLRTNDLKAEFLPDVNKIFVTVQGTQVSRMYVPRSMGLPAIRQALRRYGLDRTSETGVTIRSDGTTSSMMFSGDSAAVASVLNFVRQLDDADVARKDEANKRQEEASERERRRIQEELLRQRLDAKTEVAVIRLKNARVGSARIIIRGEPVTVPGVDETLRTLLGLDEREALQEARDQLAVQALARTAVSSREGVTDLGALPGKPTTRISLDHRTNSVIVRGDGETIALVRQILNELDTEVPLVDIEVMILQADAGTARNLGVQWSAAQADSRNRNAFGASSIGPSAANTVGGAVEEAQQNNQTRRTQTATAGTAGNVATNFTAAVNPISLLPLGSLETAVASFILADGRSFISAQLNLLAAENKAQVVSTPHVVTLNNVPASIEDKSVAHLRVSTEEGGEGDIREVDAGITLNITPSVVDVDNGRSGKDGLVQLNIDAESSTLDQAPTGEVTTQEKKVQTQVMLKDKSTLVLGGLFTTERVEQEEGIPGLKDIPLLGALFRDETSQDTRAETIFFITPTVLPPSEIRGHEDLNGSMLREYAHGQQDRLTKERRSLENRSQLINLKRLAIEEDE